jgi:hypothetical protein
MLEMNVEKTEFGVAHMRGRYEGGEEFDPSHIRDHKSNNNKWNIVVRVAGT